MLMHIVRKGVVWLAVAILPLLLFGLATSFTLVRTAGTPEPIKKILKEIGIYTSALDTVLEATDNPNTSGEGGIRSDNPVVREAAKKAFTPELIQSSTENFIDSIYVWLEGKTPTPQFRIDLTQAKATFVGEIAAGAEARARTLPACPRGQAAFEDPFAATCLPRGVPPAIAADKIRQELTGSESKFLKDPVLTADTFKSKDGTPAFSNSKLPENYQRIKKMPIILTIVTLLTLVVVVFLSENRRKGFKRAGVILVIAGVSLLLFAWFSNKVVNDQIVPQIKLESAALQEQFQKLVKNISATASKNFMTAGGVYTAIGALAVTGSIFIKRGSSAKNVTATKNKLSK